MLRAFRSKALTRKTAFLRASTAVRIWHGIGMLALVLLLMAIAGLAFWLRLQLPPDPAQVTTPQHDGPGSLRWAIENAPARSTITFDKGLQGALLLSGDDLHISRPLRIRAPGAGRLTINGGKEAREDGLPHLEKCTSPAISLCKINKVKLAFYGKVALVNAHAACYHHNI